MTPATSPRIAVAILAAGESRRLGEPKALCELPGGKPILRLINEVRRSSCNTHALEVADALGTDSAEKCRPIVVTGAHHESIATALSTAGEDARPYAEGGQVLFNANWQLGRTSSIQLAAHTSPGRDLLVIPVDHPRITCEMINQLVDSWVANGSPRCGWLAPFVIGTSGERRFGHPLLIGRELILELLEWPPVTPLRELRHLAAPLLALEVDCESILDNLDTPQALEEIRKMDQK
jgi:molybdenum cofactor cytidylyltransferase